jgi:Lecithin retinol acyltransferase/PspA/IM30 family
MRGDQIYVMQPLLNLEGMYEHHGIDYGDGTVIHYRKSSETIERTSMEVFRLGQDLIHVKAFDTSYLPEAVVHRAESRLGEQRYNLLFNNCEHFATWCKTGVSYSSQVKDFIPFIQHIDPDGLAKPIADALRSWSAPPRPGDLLNQALSDLKVIWDDTQPKYNQASQDMKSWHQVAEVALKQGREDLAKAAIARKLSSKKQATELKSQMEHLAQMTETLIRTSQSNC